jgi:DNA-binding MarR family transcriptional regulator
MRSEVHREISLLMTKMRRLCTMAVNKRLSLVGSSMHVYSVLFRLAHDAEVPQHELAIDAAIDPAAASRLIREMAADGLVTTRVDPSDKRQRFVRVTAKGRTMEHTLKQIVDDALEPYMVGLSVEEEQQFVALLRKAHDAVISVASAEEPSRVRAPSTASAGASRTSAGASSSTRGRVAGAASPRSRSTR